MKHNPELLLRLAKCHIDNKDVRIVVVSEGIGADWLAEKKEALSLGNMVILGFQPFDQLPAVMGAADVLVAILQKDAGVFSVPSKILSYMCAERPVLAAFPQENLSARIITENNAGIVVDPDDSEAFCQNSTKLMRDADLRRQMGKSSRDFAENNFDISIIKNKFLEVIAKVS
jgi:glycosyltransferase involved in cell wall biosynthesis